MTRLAPSILVLSLLAAACSAPSKFDPAPRNLVCERVAIISPKAKCTPELSGAGELASHTARVTFDVTTEDKKTATRVVACGLNASQLGMVCGELEHKAERKTEQP